MRCGKQKQNTSKSITSCQLMEKYTMAAGEPDLRLIRALTLLRNGRELFI